MENDTEEKVRSITIRIEDAVLRNDHEQVSEALSDAFRRTGSVFIQSHIDKYGHSKDLRMRAEVVVTMTDVTDEDKEPVHAKTRLN